MSVGEGHTEVMTAWLVVLVLDVVINLNTMKIGMGWAYRTRIKIFYQYVKTEMYYDLYLLIFIIVMFNQPIWELQQIVESLAIMVTGYKLSLKLSRARIQLDSFKQIVLVDSFLLLLLVAHIDVLPYPTLGPPLIPLLFIPAHLQLAHPYPNLHLKLENKVPVQLLLVMYDDCDGGLWGYHTDE